MKFEGEFFQPKRFAKDQIKAMRENARADFVRICHLKDSELVCRIGYDSVIKYGVAIIAEEGYKVRSVPGHHVKILEAMSFLLQLNDTFYFLDRLRHKRNLGLYAGGVTFTQKEAETLLTVLNGIFKEG